jgi:hypothetical protein
MRWQRPRATAPRGYTGAVSRDLRLLRLLLRFLPGMTTASRHEGWVSRVIARLREASFVSQVAMTVSILVGLFFVEYPPIFLFGYWSWGAVAHKTLTGVLLILNLILAQYAARRLGFFRQGRKPAAGKGEEEPLG